MRRETKVIILAGVFGFLVWLVDAVFDYLFFYERTFPGILATDIPSLDLYVRSAVIIFFLVFGIIMARVFAKRRRVEDVLRESEEKYRKLIESASDAIILADAETGVIIDSNRSASELFGRPAEKIVGMHQSDLHPKEESEWYREIFRGHARGEKTFTKDLHICRSDGARMPVEISSSVVEVAEKKIVQAIFRDVTERKQAEEALRQSEEWFRSIFNSAKDGIFIEDPDGRIVDVNEAVCRMLGYTKEELLKMRVSALVPPEIASRLPDTIQEETVRNGRYIETVNVRKDGSRIPVEVSNTLVEIGGEKRVVAIMRDITERKRAEEELRKSEGRFKAIFESTTDCIFVWDRDYTYLYANQAAIDHVETTRDKVVGRSIRDALAHLPDFMKLWMYRIDQVFATGKPMEVEDALPVGDKFVYSASTLSPIRDSEGEIYAVGVVYCDITDRKRVEDQLRHVQKMEAIGTLAGGLAHDFNNILAGIMGYASLTKKRLGQGSPVFADMDAIERLSRRGSDLTRALLTFSRRGEYSKRPLRINRVIEEVLNVVKRTAGKGVNVKPELSQDVSNVLGDEAQLNQVIMNLCLNACESMSKGGTLTARTRDVSPGKQFYKAHPGVSEGDYVALIVSDTGLGMDAVTRKHIFEPFFTTKSEKSGTGLGLSIVDGIVENHGGCIEVESEAGRGSTFTVYLPTTEEEVRVVRPKPPGKLGGAETILVVDDEEDFREGASRWLADLGYTAIEAVSGDEALKVVKKKKGKINLVLLDMVMDGLGGTETFRGMRELLPGLPVIICTGYSLDGDARRLLLEGANGFIQKPFDFTRLAMKVRSVLDSL